VEWKKGGGREGEKGVRGRWSREASKNVFLYI
jgi:hypothetical protein